MEKKRNYFFTLSENCNYFNFNADLSPISGIVSPCDKEQFFKKGNGCIINIEPNNLDENNVIIHISTNEQNNIYSERKINVGYEIIDNAEDIDSIREINILENVYGYAGKETYYKIKEIENIIATMLINTFIQSFLFRIKTINHSIVYSLNVYNNYFIRLPKEFYDPNNIEIYFMVIIEMIMNKKIYSEYMLTIRQKQRLYEYNFY